jgi:hypothetical protein
MSAILMTYIRTYGLILTVLMPLSLLQMFVTSLYKSHITSAVRSSAVMSSSAHASKNASKSETENTLKF